MCVCVCVCVGGYTSTCVAYVMSPRFHPCEKAARPTASDAAAEQCHSVQQPRLAPPYTARDAATAATGGLQRCRRRALATADVKQSRRRCGRVPAQMWASPGADVKQSRRRCGPVPAQMQASPGADVGESRRRREPAPAHASTLLPPHRPGPGERSRLPNGAGQCRRFADGPQARPSEGVGGKAAGTGQCHTPAAIATRRFRTRSVEFHCTMQRARGEAGLRGRRAVGMPGWANGWMVRSSGLAGSGSASEEPAETVGMTSG